MGLFQRKPREQILQINLSLRWDKTAFPGEHCPPSLSTNNPSSWIYCNSASLVEPAAMLVAMDIFQFKKLLVTHPGIACKNFWDSGSRVPRPPAAVSNANSWAWFQIFQQPVSAKPPGDSVACCSLRTTAFQLAFLDVFFSMSLQTLCGPANLYSFYVYMAMWRHGYRFMVLYKIIFYIFIYDKNV